MRMLIKPILFTAVIKFGMLIHEGNWRTGVIATTLPNPRGRAPELSPNFGTSNLQHTIRPRATKFDVQLGDRFSPAAHCFAACSCLIDEAMNKTKPFYSFRTRTNRFCKSFLPHCLDNYQGFDKVSNPFQAQLWMYFYVLSIFMFIILYFV